MLKEGLKFEKLFFSCFQVENKVKSMSKIFSLHPIMIEMWDGLSLYFHPFLWYLFGFICMIHGKSKDIFFWGLLYHAFAQAPTHPLTYLNLATRCDH